MKLTSSRKYIETTSACGMILTEHPLNAGRRPQTSEKGLLLIWENTVTETLCFKLQALVTNSSLGEEGK